MRKQKLIGVQILILICFLLLLPLPSHETNAESSVSYEHELDSRRLNDNTLELLEDSLTMYTEDKINDETVPVVTINQEDIIETMSVEIIEEDINLFSEKEMELLYKVVEAECTDQDYDSKVNVVSTIINRINDNRFPSTVEKVIYQKSQFSCVQDKRIHKVEITQETKDAVNDVIQNGTVHDALYFFNLKDVKSTKIKRWINRDLKFLFKDTSGHSFYIER